MSFLHKFTGQGGGSASTTHFCMFCSCMSKFRNQGEPGGCERCRLAGSVYDDKGIQLCLHHDHATEERKERQRVRLNHLRDKLSGKLPFLKKPVWEDKAGLRLACMKRCVPDLRTLDGRPAYDPEDVERLKTMTVTQCEAWLSARFEGTVFCIDSFAVLHLRHVINTSLYLFMFLASVRWLLSIEQPPGRSSSYFRRACAARIAHATDSHSCAPQDMLLL
jgi:hypothetical protein